ncbi:alpha/beta hydrolase [Leifsonia sp. NPDC058248]|uniref:alpha/beta hydrolase n=1 Tax=Leifsonia sp. NPDC058248 TaxID=3346402 RepID=UPI0036DCB41D
MGEIVADPGVGEPAGIRALARERSAKAVELRAVHAEVVAAEKTVTGSAWTGKAQAAFTTAMDAVAPDLLLLSRGLEAQASALHDYAGQVQQIKDQQKALEARRRSATDALTSARALLAASHRADDRVLAQERALDRDMRTSSILASRAGYTETIAENTSLLTQVDTQWEHLVTWRRHADQACMSALSGPEVLGRTAPFTPAVIRTSAPDALLRMLTGLSATDLIVLLQTHPDLADKLTTADPPAVAAWWTAMSGPTPGTPSAEQLALITAIPTIIGNLNGVAYWARDRANHVALDRALERESTKSNGDPEVLRALKSVKNALGKGMNASPPRQFVAFSMSPNFKAAVSVGSLDTAKNATYIIPGMGTNVAGDMTRFVESARGLRRDQVKASRFTTDDLAVVAWLDYEAPDASDVYGVAHDYLAERGGKRLATALNGLSAVHNASGNSSQVSVVGHSYGTNVAAFALTKARADHVVMLGSAGIASSIPNAQALNVPEGEVFATQGRHDAWAPTGQAVSGRQDPTAPTFGAHDFSSEGAVDDEGQALYEVTQHGPFAPRDETGKYSYLDMNTTSMYYTAKATTAQGLEIPVGGTPTERLSLQMQDRVDDLFRTGTPWAPVR